MKSIDNTYILLPPIAKIGCFNKHGNLHGYAIIDCEDLEKCKLYKWYYNGRYVVNRATFLHLHHVVLNIEPSRYTSVDHVNRDKWDYRKANLRIASPSQNAANVGILPNNTSGYKGVTFHRGKWIAQIKIRGMQTRIGSFNTKEEAALAYNVKAKEIHGEFAYQNEVI